MVLHLRVTCADLKIYIINDSEHGSSGSRFHLYDHLSVSPDIAGAWMYHGKTEFKVHSQFRQAPVNSVIILPARYQTNYFIYSSTTRDKKVHWTNTRNETKADKLLDSTESSSTQVRWAARYPHTQVRQGNGRTSSVDDFNAIAFALTDTRWAPTWYRITKN